MLRWTGRWRSLLLLALLWTVLNAIKPLTVDDTAYYYFARHIAADPFHPYGFEIFWYQRPEPANQVLAPPVLPYWCAIGYRLFGERPWLWKLWLFPFNLLFVIAVHSLARRLARPLAGLLVWLLVLSPVFLPSINLMLDVPAMALGMAALALFLRACGRRSGVLAVLSGLTAGLAVQTKYTAGLVPVLFLIFAFLFRRQRLGWTATTLAAGIFLAWELLVVIQHGDSHFLTNTRMLHETAIMRELKLAVVIALLPTLGALGPWLAMLGLTALNHRPAIVVGAGLVMATGYLVIAGWHVPEVMIGAEFWLEEPLAHAIFAVQGIFVAAVMSLVARRVWRQSRQFRNGESPLQRAGAAIDGFLILWLMIELAGYLVLSPFPAARRVMGVAIAATLLAGRLAARTSRVAEERLCWASIAASGIALGCLFYTVDLVDAWAQQDAAEQAAWIIAEQPAEPDRPSPATWYVGHWGFQYYAERAGMKPVRPNWSVLRPGDWLVVPDRRWDQQRIVVDLDKLDRQAICWHYPQTLPLRTVRCYYGGLVPLEHQKGPRIEVMIYRVRQPWVPLAPGYGSPCR